MCYGTLGLGTITTSLAFGKGLLMLGSKGLFVSLIYLTLAAALLIGLIAIGALTASLIEMFFGDPKSKTYKKIEEISSYFTLG